MTKYILDTLIQAMIVNFEKQHEELVNLKIEDSFNLRQYQIAQRKNYQVFFKNN